MRVSRLQSIPYVTAETDQVVLVPDHAAADGDVRSPGPHQAFLRENLAILLLSPRTQLTRHIPLARVHGTPMKRPSPTHAR